MGEEVRKALKKLQYFQQEAKYEKVKDLSDNGQLYSVGRGGVLTGRKVLGHVRRIVKMITRCCQTRRSDCEQMFERPLLAGKWQT